MQLLKDANILIVEDQEINIRLLKGMLIREGYTNVIHTDDSRQALSLFQEFQPDIVLLDLHMPHLDGFAVMEQFARHTNGDYIPILVLTADATTSTRQRALTCGAMDFINKPFRVAEVLIRVHNFLQARQLHLNLKSENQSLGEVIRQNSFKLEEAQIEMLKRLAHAAECRDHTNGNHTQRVGHLAVRLGEKLGLSEAELTLLRRAAPLHDVGKVAVPDHILLKEGKLTAEEYELMKTHTEVGARLLQNGQSEVVKMAETIALTHHEKWDGSGYPRGLEGEEIPMVGRIVALADVFDALTNERPYKDAWTLEAASQEIVNQSGRHFDPEVVLAFLASDFVSPAEFPSLVPTNEEAFYQRDWNSLQYASNTIQAAVH
jgi:putative two-component system response regulator